MAISSQRHTPEPRISARRLGSWSRLLSVSQLWFSQTFVISERQCGHAAGFDLLFLFPQIFVSYNPWAIEPLSYGGSSWFGFYSDSVLPWDLTGVVNVLNKCFQGTRSCSSPSFSYLNTPGAFTVFLLAGPLVCEKNTPLLWLHTLRSIWDVLSSFYKNVPVSALINRLIWQHWVEFKGNLMLWKKSGSFVISVWRF